MEISKWEIMLVYTGYTIVKNKTKEKVHNETIKLINVNNEMGLHVNEKD